MLHNLTQCRGEGGGLGWGGGGEGQELGGQEVVDYHGNGEGGDKANIKCIFQHDLLPRGGSSC